MVIKVCKNLAVSKRRACRVLGQERATQHHISHLRSEEGRLTAQIVKLATRYGRYGYRRITALLRQEGWGVNHKIVERIWKREGLKVPKKKPKRGRFWLNDGPCIRLGPERKDHVWSYDLMVARTADGPQSQPKFQSKSRTFFHSLITEKLRSTSFLFEILCPETGTIDLDDDRIMHHSVKYS